MNVTYSIPHFDEKLTTKITTNDPKVPFPAECQFTIFFNYRMGVMRDCDKRCFFNQTQSSHFQTNSVFEKQQQ